MGYVLAAIGYIAGYLAILFQAICIACGLYYAAELAEEYASATKKVIGWSILASVTLHVLLIFESFPLLLLGGGVACHAVYGWLLMDFPNVEIFSMKFLFSLVALFADHFIWFQYLHTRPVVIRNVFQTMALFFLLVWFVPFALFVSLSVNDNVLPSMSSPSYSSLSSSGSGDSLYYSDYSGAYPTKSSSSKCTTKKGGIRGLLDSVNSHIAPGIVKNV